MEQEFTKEEADRRAAENLRRMIATPPQPKWKPPTRSKRKDAGDAKPGKRVRVGEAS